MTRFLFFLVALPLLASCGGSNIPTCLLFAPEHSTVDGISQVQDTMNGDQVDDVVVLGTTAVDAAPLEGLTVLFDVACDDEACAPTFECAPATVDVGDTVSCAMLDDLVSAACDWNCQVSVTATALDSDVCRDALEVVQVAGSHVDAMAGR